MERIKQAIEQARAQRESVPSAKLTQQTPPAALAAKAEPTSGRVEHSITYSHTRVVQVSEATFAANKLLPGVADDEVRTAYKILRTQVEQRMAARDWNALAVTSPGPAQGKTQIAINLAISLAWEIHRTVLLVDLDLRNPSIHKRLGLPDNSPGIVDYLLGDKPLSDIMFNPGIERLVILPGGVSVSQSSELLGSPRMLALVEDLKNRYPSRFVIFDLPPLLAADDALAFSPFVDATLLIIGDGQTRKPELARAIETLGNVNLLGTVLNNSSEKQLTYY